MKFVKERVNVICQELARLSISQKIKSQIGRAHV